MTDAAETKPVDIVKSMESYFAEFQKQADEWTDKAKQIQVTDASQTGLMKSAREARLALRQVRLAVESKHKDLKEDALRTGQVLDGIKRRLKGMIEPIEQYLQEQEDFIEIQEAKRKDELRKERTELLRPYIGDQAELMQLGEMDESTFDAVLLGQKVSKEQKEAAEKEAARIKAENEEAEQKEKAERALWLARVNLITPFGLIWNADAQAYIKDDFNISLVEIKTDTDDQFAEKCLKITNEISRRREKELRDKKKQDEKLAAETAKRKEAEDKLKEQEEEAKKKIAADRKLKRAPDKTKLLSLAEQIKLLPRPELKEEESKVILRNVEVLLAKVVKYIDEQTESL